MQGAKLVEVCENDEHVNRYLLGDPETDGDGRKYDCIANCLKGYGTVCDQTHRTQFMYWKKKKPGEPDQTFFTLDGVQEPNPPVGM